MPPVRLLHAADLHLDGPVAAAEPGCASLAGQARARSLERLVALAQERRVQVVLLAGDVFHTPRPPLAAVLLLQRALAAWTEAGARVFIAPGNHDPWQPGSVWEHWREMPGVHVFSARPEGVALNDLGLWVAGAAHGSSHVEEDLAAQLPGPPPGLSGVACQHLDLPSSRHKQDHQPYAPSQLATLTSAGFAYWALGHWHKPQELCQRPRVVMAGTPQGAHWNEAGPHGAWLVEIEPGGAQSAQAELAANAPLVFHDLVLDDLLAAGDPAKLLDVAARALQPLRQPGDHAACLRLALEGPCPLWREFVGERAPESREALRRGLGLAGLALEADRLTPPVDAGELAQRPDVLGGVLRLLARAGQDPELLAELGEELAPRLHPWTRGWDAARRGQWLEDLLAEAQGLAIRDLWLGDNGA